MSLCLTTGTEIIDSRQFRQVVMGILSVVWAIEWKFQRIAIEILIMFAIATS